jgi:hypothetical protein
VLFIGHSANPALPSAALGNVFAECKIAFAVCLEHTAKKLIPVVYVVDGSSRIWNNMIASSTKCLNRTKYVYVYI